MIAVLHQAAFLLSCCCQVCYCSATSSSRSAQMLLPGMRMQPRPPSLRVVGRLWSMQGPPSSMLHGKVEIPHGVDFSCRFSQDGTTARCWKRPCCLPSLRLLLAVTSSNLSTQRLLLEMLLVHHTMLRGRSGVTAS